MSAKTPCKHSDSSSNSIGKWRHKINLYMHSTSWSSSQMSPTMFTRFTRRCWCAWSNRWPIKIIWWNLKMNWHESESNHCSSKRWSLKHRSARCLIWLGALRQFSFRLASFAHKCTGSPQCIRDRNRVVFHSALKRLNLHRLPKRNVPTH